MQTTAKEAFSLKAKEILLPYKLRFEKSLPEAFERFGPENRVKEAMIYALQGDAKRFRPALVFMVADALRQEADVSNAALTAEYFHTASLIADDMPCMDDDDYRRGRLTTHKVYGEAVALLASYAIISSGFDEIARNPGSPETVRLGVQLAGKFMGNSGLIGGQCNDLFPGSIDRQEYVKIVEGKTAALFDLSMSLGWLFGKGSPDLLPVVHRAAHHFGIIFQIIDDLDDMQQDKEVNSMNFANFFGIEEALSTVKESIGHFEEALGSLKVHSEPLLLLVRGLGALAESYRP